MNNIVFKGLYTGGYDGNVVTSMWIFRMDTYYKVIFGLFTDECIKPLDNATIQRMQRVMDASHNFSIEPNIEPDVDKVYSFCIQDDVYNSFVKNVDYMNYVVNMDIGSGMKLQGLFIKTPFDVKGGKRRNKKTRRRRL
jgi:hypothetical protein